LSVDPLPPTKSVVTSRTLWLDGFDGHNANTRDRFICIHATKHEDKIDNLVSHGFVRMRHAGVIGLSHIQKS
jgi:hypothetical protein